MRFVPAVIAVAVGAWLIVGRASWSVRMEEMGLGRFGAPVAAAVGLLWVIAGVWLAIDPDP